MNLVNLIVTLVSGAIGGNLAGKALPQKDLGVVANSIIGIVGAFGGDYILRSLGIIASAAENGASFDLTSLLVNIVASGVSGGVFTAIVSYVKCMCSCCKK